MPACPDGVTVFEWLTLANLAHVAATSAQGSATPADQWGWCVRELMAQLLQNKEIGEVWLSHILTPIVFRTSLAQFDYFVIGGKLIGLRKPDKVDVNGVSLPGCILPILISNADRKLVARAMMCSCSEELAEYFLKHHQQVVQCGVGVPDGQPRHITPSPCSSPHSQQATSPRQAMLPIPLSCFHLMPATR